MQLIIKNGVIIATHKDDQNVVHKYADAAAKFVPDDFRYDTPRTDSEDNEYSTPRPGDPDPTAGMTSQEIDAIKDAQAEAMINNPLVASLIEEFTERTGTPGTPEAVKAGVKQKLKNKL